MKLNVFLTALTGLLLLAHTAHADAPLKSSLDLDMHQAKQVRAIQKAHRKPFSAKRQELNRENRKLRRARIDNDSELMAEQAPIVAKLRHELTQIRLSENQQIREVLTPEQRVKFEEVIAQRAATVGSSRDVKLLSP